MQELTQKQRQVMEFLVNFSQERGYPPTVRDICLELGLKSPNTAHFHLKALQEKGFVRIASGKNRGITLLKNLPEYGLRIPVMGNIAAGEPIFADENITGDMVADRDFFSSPDAFSVRVRGDSMKDAFIQEGDYAIISPERAPKNGDIVAALIDEAVTLKYFQKKADMVRLVPANPAYQPLEFEGEKALPLRILGVMVGLVRKL
jgi:repressor LexA